MSNIPWPPFASFEAIRRRARLLAEIRAFFAERGVLEVETPHLSRAATTEPHIASLSVHTRFPDPEPLFFLCASPEFAMKRLLAAGSGSIYQIGRAFRDGERGSRHNPEFTLLEWYRVGFDHHALMDEVAELLVRLGASTDCERLSYREAFVRTLRIDPLSAVDEDLHRAITVACSELTGSGMTRDDCLDYLLSHVVAPQLGRDLPVFLYDYPSSQAALAKISEDNPRVCERFELFMQGLEIANGFHELQDAAEQRKRFEQENRRRKLRGEPVMPVDEHVLAALEAGLPACAGVALGIDRLLMVLGRHTDIREVLGFPIERA